MTSEKLKLFYSLTHDEIKEDIEQLNIVEELKKGLYETNEKLYNYSLKLNSNKIKTKMSFYYILSSLKHEEAKEIFNFMRRMFKLYNLCNGEYTYFDIYEDNPVKVLDNIEDYDFWLIDFTDCYDVDLYKHFTTDLKKCCRDLNKCIFIVCYDELLDKVNEDIEKEKNIYKKYKYNFDYIFHITNDGNNFRRLKDRLQDNGYEVDFNPKDIKNARDYIDNEIYIENALIKSNLLEKSNIISTKELNEDVLNEKYIKLDNMIGLKNVKEEIKNLEYLLRFHKDINKTNDVNLNVIFKGNPGTGKTTVAKNYANLLYNLGYIEKNKVVEIVPSDLTGEYLGQTKTTAREILEKATGGVLFIDEAYNLNEARVHLGGEYMREALIELLKYMEDRKNVVVFAGYKLEMEDLLNVNPGFKSRIGSVIDFDDYTTAELVKIFKLDASKYDLKCTNGFVKKLKERINNDKWKKNFGNARYIENLLNKVLYVHAANVYDKDADIYLLTEEDFKIKEESINSFGFAKTNE